MRERVLHRGRDFTIADVAVSDPHHTSGREDGLGRGLLGVRQKVSTRIVLVPPSHLLYLLHLPSLQGRVGERLLREGWGEAPEVRLRVSEGRVFVFSAWASHRFVS